MLVRYMPSSRVCICSASFKNDRQRTTCQHECRTSVMMHIAPQRHTDDRTFWSNAQIGLVLWLYADSSAKKWHDERLAENANRDKRPPHCACHRPWPVRLWYIKLKLHAVQQIHNKSNQWSYSAIVPTRKVSEEEGAEAFTGERSRDATRGRINYTSLSTSVIVLSYAFSRPVKLWEWPTDIA